MDAKAVAKAQADVGEERHALHAQQSAPPRFLARFLPGARAKAAWHQHVSNQYALYGAAFDSCVTDGDFRDVYDRFDTFASNEAECDGRGLYMNPEEL